MKKTGWMNCKETQPVRAGYYEVRLWENYGRQAYYGDVLRCYFDGKKWRNNDKNYRLIGKDRPGWHKMDEWRGVVRHNVEVQGRGALNNNQGEERCSASPATGG